MTYEDYLHFPEGERWELIDGSAFLVPSPNRRHQAVVLELATRLHTHLRQYGGGEAYVAPFDVVLSDFDIVQPDIVFVADVDLDVLTEENIRGRPSWVIEVISPTHPERDRKLKLERFERFGIPEYWIVDPVESMIEVHRLAAGAYGAPIVLRPPAEARPLVPADFAMPLEELFATP